jgi:hypothetical protein
MVKIAKMIATRAGRRGRFTGASAAAALGFAVTFGWALGASAAGDPELLGTFDHWTAFSYSEGGTKICYTASEPTRAQGKYTQRGDIIALVTHNPAEKTFDVVSFVAGYTYKQDSSALVNIGGKKFELFTHEDRAWAPNEAMDKSLVQTMRRGSRMVVVGTSSRGTRTTDTYSLIGFTKAYQKIAAACPAKKPK